MAHVYKLQGPPEHFSIVVCSVSQSPPPCHAIGAGDVHQQLLLHGLQQVAEVRADILDARVGQFHRRGTQEPCEEVVGDRLSLDEQGRVRAGWLCERRAEMRG